MRRSLTLLHALMLCAAFACGCGGARSVSLREGPREYVASDYEAILKRWTRSERLYSLQGVEDVLSVSATFESWDFRWAYVVRYAEDYRLSVDQRRELLTRATEGTREHHQFYIALYGGRPLESDLTRANPTWVVRLVDDKGNISAPAEIVPIKKPTVLERTYFPYTTVWRQAFRVRFPTVTAAGYAIAANSGAITLRFSGPLGNLELHWAHAL